MSIQKQDFYEGAALHQLARCGGIRGLEYIAPLFLLNGTTWILLKYSTKKRSPWGFTFTASEQELLRVKSEGVDTIFGLICGADGVVTISYSDFLSVAGAKEKAVRISCFRDHGQHYNVSGPNGKLSGKVSPSKWQKILMGAS